ncbi:MAG: CPBP family intramembrane glutamic endopeptidase [Pseudomonadota bacterium]
MHWTPKSGFVWHSSRKGPLARLNETPPTRRRRLQRDKDFTGERLSSFREVFLRHGFPGLVLAIICLMSPTLQSSFADALARAATHAEYYVAIYLLIFAGLSAYAWRLDRRWNAAQLGWIVYLGALSFWEEWVFRLAIPQSLETLGASVWLAALLSAVLFGGLHYFTLRWKWPWCVSAAIGGLALSQQMEIHNDLLWITAFHWIGTSFNTPRPPGRSAQISAA